MNQARMSQEGKPLEVPVEVPAAMPAPQLPNLPASPDDPFQPDIERQTPVTSPSQPPPPQADPAHTNKRGETDLGTEPR